MLGERFRKSWIFPGTQKIHCHSCLKRTPLCVHIHPSCFTSVWNHMWLLSMCDMQICSWLEAQGRVLFIMQIRHACGCFPITVLRVTSGCLLQQYPCVWLQLAVAMYLAAVGSVWSADPLPYTSCTDCLTLEVSLELKDAVEIK
jgi:hypothetical protein